VLLSLQLLPPEVERIELPRAIQSVAGLLRSRAQVGFLMFVGYDQG
jgi:hypothetical protein